MQETDLQLEQSNKVVRVIPVVKQKLNENKTELFELADKMKEVIF